MGKNNIYIALSVLMLVVFSCGPEKDPEKNPQTDTATAVDTTPKKVFKDPAAPPTAEYSGDHIVKYPNGITQFRGFFRFGKRHGTWTNFYEDGKMAGETSYDNGKKEGRSVVYFPNGKVKYEGQYKNNEYTGTWKFYDESGKLAEEKKY